jgi:hypothetical protein
LPEEFARLQCADDALHQRMSGDSSGGGIDHGDGELGSWAARDRLQSSDAKAEAAIASPTIAAKTKCAPQPSTRRLAARPIMKGKA